MDKTVLVYDNGLFVELAIRLSKEFSKVYYYVPNENAFVKSYYDLIGDGIDEIERVKGNERFWSLVDSGTIDLFIFPDVYAAGTQNHLYSLGHLVFGNRSAEFLELDRWKTREIQTSLKMPVPETLRFFTLSDLRDYLDSVEDKWVKVSYYRGDMETFHHVKPFTSEPFFDKLEHTLGAQKYNYEFVVEQAIPGVEFGYDGLVVDGKYPDTALWGYEIKDLGYVGKIDSYKNFPKVLRDVNDSLAPIFKGNQSRGFFSTEVRIGKDKVPYLTDPCMRCGSPPTEVNMECYDNLGEMIWETANGRVPTVKANTKFAIIAMMHSGWADGNWMAVDFPKELRRWIKFRNLTVINGKHYVVPCNTGLPEIGAVIGTGNTLNEAVEKVKDIADQVSGYDLDIKTKSIEDALLTINEGEGYGIRFARE